MGGSIVSATIPAVTEGKCTSASTCCSRCPNLLLPLVMSGSEDEAAPVMKAEFGRLLTAIIRIQDQMQSMKREMAEEREAVNEQLVKH